MKLLWKYQSIMDWLTKKQEFTQQFNQFNQTESQVNQWITEIYRDIGSYIERGGLSQEPNQNPQFTDIQEKLNRVNSIKKQYNTLHTNIQTYLQEQSKKTDWSKQLHENGRLQGEINRLENIEKEMKVDVDSALARDELLRTRNTNVTRHDLFLLNHPIRRSIVPYLWVFSVCMIGVGLLFWKTPMEEATLSNTGNIPSPLLGSLLLHIWSFFSNQMVYVTLLVSVCIVIVVVGLKMGGIF
jgi:hypothetical protein